MRSKASVKSTPARSASTPLACSITTRLVSAADELLIQAPGFDMGAILHDADGGKVGEGTGDDDGPLPPSGPDSC